ncbi:unnamed protein product [Phytophthora fragariaefolia]|uniref:Unnamed protein product n=1 Tax=Phytophthora fragariaefolia TaxID=1490495 RepID=A0A9W6TSK2_9STRA|nr:unnamed protein product [Phytophthora fragariaefolia]
MVFTPTDDGYAQNHYAGERTEVAAGRQPETGGGATATGTSRVPQPIFSFVLAPRVASIARDELVEWLKLRKEYEEAVKERCKDGKEDIKAVLKSVKNSFDADLLETLCEVNWGVTKDELTDEFLLEQIRAITDSYQNQVLPPVNELFQKELRMDMNNKDITARVTSYFMSCNTLIKKLADCLPTQTRSIVLGDAFKVAFCADSGADRSGMSVKVYEKFVEACPEAEQAVELEEPLTCKGADGKTIEVKMTVKLHLKLTTAAGIDVLRQLDMLVANAMRGERDDEFDDVDEPQIGSSAALSAEVLAAVEIMIERALGKGFPTELVPTLRRLATRFDLWRLRLGDDPPACVPPMKVRLKPGAKPYRCKARNSEVPRGASPQAFARLDRRSAIVSTHLVKLERLFELLDFFGFKLSPKKSSLFEREVRWCGKLINGDGVHHDPERIRALQAMPYPRSAAELQQFLCATNWMRDSLIDYARVARPLQDTLDDALSRASKRTKRAAAGVAIELSAVQRESFDEMKNMLSRSVTLANPKDGATMGVLTDASDIGWSLYRY